jgi:EGF domain
MSTSNSFPADIDECAVNNGGCNPGATCVNTPGSFTCVYMDGILTQAGYVCFGKPRKVCVALRKKCVFEPVTRSLAMRGTASC